MASKAGFDKYTSVFSPEGTLYQVEYAFKAVSYPGLLTVAIRCKDAALVVTQHQVPDRLMRPDSVTSLYKVSEDIGCCVTGRAPDGRNLVQRAREESRTHKFNFGLPIPVSLLAKRLGDKAQVRTQQAGLRPMGVVATFIGMEQRDEDGAVVPRIYAVDPAGWVAGYHAYAVGKKQIEASAYLEKRQKEAAFETLSVKEAAMIILSALENAIGEPLKASDVEMGRVTSTTRTFEKIPDSEVEEWLTAVAEAD